jgi:hypothetical protein
MPVNTHFAAELSVVQLLRATRVADGTVATSDDFDTRDYAPGSRFLVILEAFETDAGNSGGTWTVVESETDGGDYTAADTSGSLAVLAAEAGNHQRVVTVRPNSAKPFVHAVFTGDASTDLDVTATLVVLPRHAV